MELASFVGVFLSCRTGRYQSFNSYSILSNGFQELRYTPVIEI